MAEELESPGDPETPTPSLQRRVILLVVALLAVLLVVLGVTIDVSLGLQARRNLHDLLLAATSRADALASVGTSPELIAAEINGGSVRALLVTADGATYGDPNISPDTTAGPAVPALPGPPPLIPPGGHQGPHGPPGGIRGGGPGSAGTAGPA
ncbi:two-component sensor histidine kinase, partial [Mycobacterium ulcerans]